MALELDGKMGFVACSVRKSQWQRTRCPPYTDSPHVHKQWKLCAHGGLTVRNRASSLNRFSLQVSRTVGFVVDASVSLVF